MVCFDFKKSYLVLGVVMAGMAMAQSGSGVTEVRPEVPEETRERLPNGMERSVRTQRTMINLVKQTQKDHRDALKNDGAIELCEPVGSKRLDDFRFPSFAPGPEEAELAVSADACGVREKLKKLFAGQFVKDNRLQNQPGFNSTNFLSNIMLGQAPVAVSAAEKVTREGKELRCIVVLIGPTVYSASTGASVEVINQQPKANKNFGTFTLSPSGVTTVLPEKTAGHSDGH